MIHVVGTGVVVRPHRGLASAAHERKLANSQKKAMSSCGHSSWKARSPLRHCHSTKSDAVRTRSESCVQRAVGCCHQMRSSCSLGSSKRLWGYRRTEEAVGQNMLDHCRQAAGHLFVSGILEISGHHNCGNQERYQAAYAANPAQAPVVVHAPLEIRTRHLFGTKFDGTLPSPPATVLNDIKITPALAHELHIVHFGKSLSRCTSGTKPLCDTTCRLSASTLYASAQPPLSLCRRTAISLAMCRCPREHPGGGLTIPE